MASVYKTVLQKNPQGGYASNPEQTQGNAGSPSLDNALTIRNGMVLGTAVVQGKKVFNSLYTATVDQIGNSRLDEAIAGGVKVFGYIALGIATGGLGVPIVAGLAEVATLGITTAVNNHAIDLDNDRIRAERGTRVNLGVGYYG